MGFPDWATEQCYRNPINQVERFLENKHGGHYRIYNLFSERPEYDSSKRFNGKCKRFPFDDHNAPCLISLILDFVNDATDFLEEDKQNVVVVHCKTGKGRTGVMVSCLLLSLEPLSIPNAEEAVKFFGNARTQDGFEVTIPSRSHYVHYYDRTVYDFGGKLPPARSLVLYQITIDSDIKPSGQVDFYFTVHENGIEKINSRHFLLLDQYISLQSVQKKKITLKDKELDGRPAKTRDEEEFCKDLAVSVIFLENSSVSDSVDENHDADDDNNIKQLQEENKEKKDEKRTRTSMSNI
ncbi:Dual specificity phosphatase [Trypanosoma melophagium]|uniref:Dual specificity phosphatase n=1 Tax=Trypanosoma melophagium TaxID=715481 RepID=UPI00351A5239|nr:Dual specificity phosphatase [Trypanosoma melophagium]